MRTRPRRIELPLWMIGIIVSFIVVGGLVGYIALMFASAVWLGALVEEHVSRGLGICTLIVVLGMWIVTPWMTWMLYSVDKEERANAR